ncbi:site-specific integrase [Staphylococcus simulans]|uniref:site-specific integrase n=1 Tax=Staphylococcus simulans TaxID=1286 RepID=UPI0021CF8CA9|nr:site-specific integrase [Staphylococcus simulans]UXR34709.1 site-specific integrase [Staphylococcus simulans]
MTVRKDKNKWMYDFSYNHKRYRKKGFKTKRKAQEAELQRLNSVSHGQTMSCDTSFTDYFKLWLEVNKENKISDKAYQRYLSSLEIFEDCFGNIPIAKVTQLDYRNFLKAYGEGKFLKGRSKGRTTESVRKLHYCLKGAFEDALESGVITRNPTYKAIPQGTKKAKNEDVKFMNETTYNALRDYAKQGKQMSHLVLYMLCITGARFSEIANMKYDDLNMKDNLIHIRGTKTKTSDRLIPISSESKKHIMKRIYELPRTLDDHIFNTGTGIISNTAVTKTMRRFLTKNNLGRYTLHALRHTHASVLLKEGFPIQYISKRLGHADIKTTLDTYSHLLDEQKLEEDEKLLRYMKNF